MPEPEAPPHSPPFGLLALWLETARMLRRHAGDLLRVLLLPALLQLGLVWLGTRTAGTGGFWPWLAAIWLSVALFATNCHRVVLGDPGPIRRFAGLWLDTRVLWYLGWSFLLVLIGLVASVPVLILATMALPALFPELTPDERTLLLQGVGSTFMVLLLYFLLRLSLVLPAAALGRDTYPGESWYLTQGHGWRLVIGLALPTVATGLVLDGLGRLARMSDSTAVALTVALVATLAAAVGVVTLSCAWRLLAPDDGADPDDPVAGPDDASSAVRA